VNFIPGYAILLIDLFQIFLICLFGTFLEIKSEKFFLKLTTFPWMNLPLTDQKSLIMIMSSAIEVKSVSNGLGKLNLDSFVEVKLFRPMNFANFVFISDVQVNLFILHGFEHFKESSLT
jgi:hypothetical protein